MRGPETPVVLLRASDRMSRSRIWAAVHRRPVMSEGVEQEPTEPETAVACVGPVRLGERGSPVPQPRRSR